MKRMQRILRVARRHFSNQDFRHFHNLALHTMRVLHPNAGKKLLESIGNEQQFRGKVKAERNVEQFRAGEISSDQMIRKSA
jgi:hypothetical protein